MTLLTIEKAAAEVAKRNAPAKVAGWQIRVCIRKGLLSEPEWLGAFRVFTLRDVPKITQALQRAGYLPTTQAESVEAVQ